MQKSGIIRRMIPLFSFTEKQTVVSEKNLCYTYFVYTFFGFHQILPFQIFMLRLISLVEVFMKLKRIISLCLILLFCLTTPAYAAQSRTITVDPIDVLVGGSVFLPTDVTG